MGTEATLIYNLWIFSWLINLIRRVTGVIWGFSGRVLFLALETLDTYYTQVSQLQHLPYHVWRKYAEQQHALLCAKIELSWQLHMLDAEAPITFLRVSQNYVETLREQSAHQGNVVLLCRRRANRSCQMRQLTLRPQSAACLPQMRADLSA